MSGLTNIPKEHQLRCEGCKELLDMRDVNTLSHGWIEEGKIVCFTDINITYNSSKKVGEPIEWDKVKNPIHLN